MKKTLLLSALCGAYFGCMYLLFSSGFGKENSFLINEKEQHVNSFLTVENAGDILSNPQTASDGLIESFEVGGHSPESANGDQ